jgi:hypothetical protein
MPSTQGINREFGGSDGQSLGTRGGSAAPPLPSMPEEPALSVPAVPDAPPDEVTPPAPLPRSPAVPKPPNPACGKIGLAPSPAPPTPALAPAAAARSISICSTVRHPCVIGHGLQMFTPPEPPLDAPAAPPMTPPAPPDAEPPPVPPLPPVACPPVPAFGVPPVPATTPPPPVLPPAFSSGPTVEAPLHWVVPAKNKAPRLRACAVSRPSPARLEPIMLVIPASAVPSGLLSELPRTVLPELVLAAFSEASS